MPDFDPYHKWLGISPDDRRLNHYRVLGIGLFESDPDVIANAADQRMIHIRTFQGGRHSDLSQKILNEIAAARVCLLNAAKKAEYDEQLRQQLAASSQATAPSPPPMPSQSSIRRGASQGPAKAEHASRGSVRRKNRSPYVLVVLGTSAFVCLTIITILILTKPKKEDAVPTPETPSVVGKVASPVKKVETPVVPKPVEKEPVAPATANTDGKKTPSPVEPKIETPPVAKKVETPTVTPPEKSPPPEPPKKEPPVVVAPAIPSLEQVEQGIKSRIDSASKPPEFEAISEDALRLTDRAIVESNQDFAKRAVSLALSAARKSGNPALAKKVTLRLIEVQSPPSDAMKQEAKRRLDSVKPAAHP